VSGIRVLVTNADYANALAAVRSLGKHGVEVVCGSTSKHAQSFYSRYCASRFIYPSPQNETAFVKSVADRAISDRIDVVLPIGYDANTVLSKHLGEFDGVTEVPVVTWDSMKVASDKAATMEFAKNLGIGIPRTYSTIDDVDSFPVVVKGAGGAGRLRYVNSRQELAEMHPSESVMQEYVPGVGYGYFALFNKGELKASFMHRRIREYPVTGGASSAAESVHDPELERAGSKLLKSLNWHGVAMAEFKKDTRDGKFKLMEINPKFWGSLDLSIVSGIDFPYLDVKMAMDGDVEPVVKYRTGERFTWPFPNDVMHVLARPSSAPAFLHDVRDRNVHTNIWLDDVFPNVFQLVITIGTVVVHLKRGDLKHPHGIARVMS